MTDRRSALVAVFERIARRADELVRTTRDPPGPSRDLLLWRVAETEILKARLALEPVYAVVPAGTVIPSQSRIPADCVKRRLDEPDDLKPGDVACAI